MNIDYDCQKVKNSFTIFVLCGLCGGREKEESKMKESSFRKASIPVKIIAIIFTTLIVILISPFWIVLLVVNFVESPKTAWHILIDKENWRPFGRREGDE